jgi:UDP-2-acetamido-2-deoxy-ribo-hexuluronate aminotransferase
MDLLIDVNVVIDICAQRLPYAHTSAAALNQGQANGVKLWLYTGSVQTLEYNLLRELKRNDMNNSIHAGLHASNREWFKRTRQLLKAFAADKQWLASLAGEGDVFDSPDPEDEQLIRALDRFKLGSIKLLTRDSMLCERYPLLTITPEQYLQIPLQSKVIDFMPRNKTNCAHSLSVTFTVCSTTGNTFWALKWKSWKKS